MAASITSCEGVLAALLEVELKLFRAQRTIQQLYFANHAGTMSASGILRAWLTLHDEVDGGQD